MRLRPPRLRIRLPRQRARTPSSARRDNVSRRPFWRVADRVISCLLIAGTVVTAVLAARMEFGSPAGRSGAAHAPIARLTTPRASSGPAHSHHGKTRTLHRSARPRTHRSAGRPQARTYTVRPGDSLSSIARRLYGPRGNWTSLYRANSRTIADPSLIYAGQVLRVPASPARPLATTTSLIRPTGGTGATLGCSGLEALWERAGGSPAAARTAASIALAESGGDPLATGADGERGYWQISLGHGALSTYDPYGNARAAVAISGNGTDWDPWTTYTDGAYSGRC